MTPPATPTVWHADQLDLDAYLARIGLPGEHPVTRATLFDVYRAHLLTIPFENFEIILGRGLQIDLASVQGKLVDRRRGGYCFEHVTLLAAALERLGFEIVGVLGRVLLHQVRTIPSTHALLTVKDPEDGRTWLCDIGFGSGPLAPIEVAEGAEVDLDGWGFVLEREDGPYGIDLWTLRQRGEEGWEDRNRFTLSPVLPVDLAVGNHYVSTHPRSPFVARPFVQKFTLDALYQLDGATWTTRLPDGTATERRIAPAEVGPVLTEHFGIELDPADLAAVEEWLAGHA
ncbi:arylamine N-acetyltransferase [Streptomyces sp. NPDC089919]|uniref:arylamine N-acetyltransferase family protein n=1 Tax=Streptomyces sp. NPDC089919 TaxID=3155188 RepID=UPI00343C1FB7